MTRSRHLVRSRTITVLAAAVLAAGLTACAGDDNAASSVDGGTSHSGGDVAGSNAYEDGGEIPAGADPLAARDSGGAEEPARDGGSGTRTSARVLPAGRDVVYRGAITVRVKNVGAASARAESLATGAGGVVFAEQISTDPRDRRRGQASLTLRVPPTVFGTTLDNLARLGKELDRTRSAEDVTTQVADVDSRVRSQERSVERVRTLLDRATTIGEVVRVESELAQRESDLESLQAQLARLRDVTDLATIEVVLVSPDRADQTVADEEDLGFLSGLRGGWDAFVGIVLVGLTVAGALVPFAITVALLGVPLYLVLRSRRRTPAPATSPADA